MRKNLVSLLVVAMVFSWATLSCSNLSENGEGEQIEKAEPARLDEKASPAAQRGVSNESSALDEENSGFALVQLLMFGLMTFELDDSTGSRRAWALAPFIRGGGPIQQHYATIKYGKYDSGSGYSWEDLVDSPNEVARLIFNQPVGNLQTDFGYVLHADEIANESPAVNRAGANFKFLIESGNLTTCGLVHNAYSNHVCKVKAGEAFRTMSEYLVVWWRIPDSTTVQLEVGDDTYDIDPTGDKHSGYDNLYDLAFTNIPEESSRSNQTDHLEELRTRLFPTSSASWKNFSYSDCTPNTQLKCISRYKGWDGFPSGGDRPLCPFIGVGP